MSKCLSSKCNNEILRLSPRANNKKFCSKECRNNHYHDTGKDRERWTKRNAITRERNSQYQAGKLQCLICKRWFRFLILHTRQFHGINASEYKEEFGIDRGRGLISQDIKEIKSEKTHANGTIENLKRGARTRFRKGDKKLGCYKRRAETLETLKILHKFNKKYEKNKIPHRRTV